MEVWFRGRTVGQVTVEAGQTGVHWQAECQVQTADILRLYGLRDGCAPLRIDVAEPVGDVLRVQRTLRWSALRAAGYDTDCLPDRYVLDAGDGLQASCPPVTGDVRLDALVADGVLTCVQEGTGWRLSLPFRAGQECPLAFALTACRIIDGQAVLRLHAKVARTV